MIRVNILLYRGRRHGMIATVLLLLAWILFASQADSAPPSGSTWQGYVLGGLSILMVIWLAALGIRKRRYQTSGRVQAWVSAHAYLGIALLGIATFHSAGQLGWNIHSAAYWIMVVVIGSGILGTGLYLVLPRRMAENRKGLSRAELFEELRELNGRCTEISSRCSPATELAVQSSISGTVLGGTVWDQLFATDKSSFLSPSDVHDLDVTRSVPNQGQSEILQFIASRATRVKAGVEPDALARLVSLIARRQELLRRIRKDIQLMAWLQVWLYLHVPLTIALLCALIVHLTVVFLYW
jgi:hypothetical protein